MPIKDHTQRFSSRVEDYVRHRSGYPPQIIQLLKTECGLTSDSVIADVASGTGILPRMFLDHRNRVFAVEPNAEMRQAWERLLPAHPNCISTYGTSEETTLTD